MKRSLDDLRSRLAVKIDSINDLLSRALQCEIASKMRTEIASEIAVILRTVFCQYDKSLIKQCKYESRLRFIWALELSAYNTSSEYKLVAITVSNGIATFSSLQDYYVGKENKGFYFSVDAWLKETVINFKQKGYEPLSRFKVIKLLADKEGAHVDAQVEKNFDLIENTNVMPIGFIWNNQPCNYNGGNLLTETLLTIAMEVVYAFRNLFDMDIRILKKADVYLYKISHVDSSYYLYALKPQNYLANYIRQYDDGGMVTLESVYEYRYINREGKTKKILIVN